MMRNQALTREQKRVLGLMEIGETCRDQELRERGGIIYTATLWHLVRKGFLDHEVAPVVEIPASMFGYAPDRSKWTRVK